MAIDLSTEWTLDYTAKTITHTGTTTIRTVNQLYSWLMDVFDELSQMDDPVPMTAQTPTEYTLINGWTIPDSSFAFLSGGALKTSDGASLWSNIYTLGSIQVGTNIYVVQNGSKITAWWAAGHIDVLVKVKSGSALINSGLVTVYARELGNTYSHYDIDLSSGGRNAVPLATDVDLNNQTASGTIAGYSDITITFGTVSKTLGTVTKNYDVTIDCDNRPLAQVYEYLKYITRSVSAVTLNGVLGWQYKDANSSYSPEQKSPFGTFAGGKFFGARGVWIQNYATSDVKNFQLISADNTVVTPPNIVTVQVTGVVSGDRVLVAAMSGGAINKSQYTLASGNNQGNGTVVVETSISLDTPASGYVRIGDDRYQYDSWTGSTFTLHTGVTLSKTYSLHAPAYVPYIDTQATDTTVSNLITYVSDITALVRVRKIGIIPFEVSGVTITSTGLSASAIRATDSIVSA